MESSLPGSDTIHREMGVLKQTWKKNGRGSSYLKTHPKGAGGDAIRFRTKISRLGQWREGGLITL